jgi:hypothetical protein
MHERNDLHKEPACTHVRIHQARVHREGDCAEVLYHVGLRSETEHHIPSPSFSWCSLRTTKFSAAFDAPYATILRGIVGPIVKLPATEEIAMNLGVDVLALRSGYVA